MLQRLRQDVPGQLAAICRQMDETGVNIEVNIDLDDQLVLVVEQDAAVASGRQRVDVRQSARQLT